MACCGNSWFCCRQSSVENGMDCFTLRFVDPMKEEGFARTHKAELCHYLALAMGAMAAIGLLTGLTAHRFWDDAQYPTTHAQELSKWQMLIHMVIILSLILAFGSGRLLANLNLVSTLGLEIIVVSASTCFMLLMVIIPKHYLARAFGYDDPEAIWGVDLGGTDGNVVLYIDCVVTALHFLLPIRWVVLVPVEVIAVLAYTLPALLLGSPAMSMVPYNIIGLLVLTVFAAIGKRAFERQERALFAGLLAEKKKRFQAEFQLSRVEDISSETSKDAKDDRGSERSAALSRPGTTLSEAAFDGTAELDQIRAIGNREQWLIAGGDVKLLPDRVLGEGGFGVVVAGLYHNTLVAIKAPREEIMSKGVMSSCLPELCNELRILRRIRHPNIAVMYGACMDATLHKLCLVLEFVDGMPLGVFVQGLSQVPSKLAERSRGIAEGNFDGYRDGSASARSLIVFDILNVLRFLHSRQPAVVHGDLKDSNVFVEERHSKSGRSTYHAKLLDFGLSRLLTQNARPLGGTLRWMAPELLARQAVPPDATADCYSFGLLAYFVLTGCLPFKDRGKEQVLSRLRRGQRPGLAWPTFADELTQAVRPVVEQCTQPKPALRPTAQRLGDELSTVLERFTSGAMEKVVETVGIRRAGAGSGSKKKSFGATADPAPGKELQELFAGLVGVSQVGSSSSSVRVGSLVPGRSSSRNLPSVQEHEVLLPEEAPKDAAESAHEQLTHPQYRRTPRNTQTLTLAYLLAQWNVSAPAGSCCWLHGALHSLDRARRQLQRRPCNVQQGSLVCGQCDTCGLMLAHGDSACEFCEVPEASGSVDESARSNGALAV
ncbi:unnamed protein product [Prorocentrum cordatum]|uniref:Protein kinase domain-containing protein n=1 Tax=Prorocentrum cordatum TaxID=2364126 RepID=A0ABN9USX0_9DINO|nr:unnamed protein product [Polarella glacialis]